MSQPQEGKGLVGLVPLAVGLALFGIAAFRPGEAAFPSGRLAVVAAGATFFFAGTAILINGLETPYKNVLLTINSTLLLGAFAAVPSLLFFGARSNASTVLLVSALLCLGLVGVALRAVIGEIRRLSRGGKAAQAGAADERHGSAGGARS